MLNTLKKYKEWVVIIFLLLGWIGTVAGWVSSVKYDRKIRQDMIKQMEEFNKNWEEQLNLNGQFIMYMKLDSQ